MSEYDRNNRANAGNLSLTKKKFSCVILTNKARAKRCIMYVNVKEKLCLGDYTVTVAENTKSGDMTGRP